jgi:hypothetical protein
MPEVQGDAVERANGPGEWEAVAFKDLRVGDTMRYVGDARRYVVASAPERVLEECTDGELRVGPVGDDDPRPWTWCVQANYTGNVFETVTGEDAEA